MYLNRSLIKRQAKELIRGNVFKLFIITLIVSLCVSLVSGIISGISNYRAISRWSDMLENFQDGDNFEDYFNDYFSDYFDDYFDGYTDGYDDSDYFSGFGDEGWDFNNFNFNGELPLIPAKNEAAPAAYNSFSLGFFNGFSYIPFIITALLSPLAVTLAGLYVSFIRGKNFGFDAGIKSVFQNAFKVNYLKKMGVFVLRTVIISLLSILFIIPGIIFSYSSYFAFQIMCDYPQLSAWEAIKLSKKIIKGNRIELFLMNLSFIPWAFLCIFAFLFPIIYLLPYMETTNALYYENFRLRAIQQGRVTEDDFLSDAQRCAKYGAMGNNRYYSAESAQQGTYYHTQQQPQQPQAPQYGVPNYSAQYQQYNQNVNQQQYYAVPNTPPVQPNIPPAQPNTPPVQPQAPPEQPAPPQEPTVNEYEAPAEPQETPNEPPKPAEPTDYPWEGK